MIQLSIRDMPAVDAFLGCALPIIFVDPSHPEFPGIGGTCFAVRYEGRLFFLTAGHCLRDVEADNVWIPVTFNRQLETWPIAKIGRPAVLKGSEYGTGLDVALMVPATEPRFEKDHATPLGLELIANMQDVPTNALFAVRGFPRGKGIDYDQATISRD